MSTIARERSPLTALAALILGGAALLLIPWFLTPPASLDLALRDGVFGSNLAAHSVAVTDDLTGRTMTTAVQKIGGVYLARLGRINSGAGAFTARVSGFQPVTTHVRAAALQPLRVPLDLTPTFGRLELTMWNAMRNDEPIDATVKDGARAVTTEPQRMIVMELPPGTHRLSAQAPGYCASERDFDIQAGKVTKAAFPLSPDLPGDEIARFVLGWRNEPRDLDTHFWKADTTVFPSATTVYFAHKEGVMPNGGTFARLDVDELYPGRYETLSVRNSAVGAFRYFVHVYQGAGTIADAVPTVQVYTSGCHVRTFTPPADCAYRIWNVTNLTYADGSVHLNDVQRCEPEGTVSVRKPSR